MATLSTTGLKIELTRNCLNDDPYDYVRDQPKTEWCAGGTIREIFTDDTGRRAVRITGRKCTECRGTGEILTDEGEMIVDLVRTWLPTTEPKE